MSFSVGCLIVLLQTVRWQDEYLTWGVLLMYLLICLMMVMISWWKNCFNTADCKSLLTVGLTTDVWWPELIRDGEWTLIVYWLNAELNYWSCLFLYITSLTVLFIPTMTLLRVWRPNSPKKSPSLQHLLTLSHSILHMMFSQNKIWLFKYPHEYSVVRCEGGLWSSTPSFLPVKIIQNNTWITNICRKWRWHWIS